MFLSAREFDRLGNKLGYETRNSDHLLAGLASSGRRASSRIAGARCNQRPSADRAQEAPQCPPRHPTFGIG